MIIGIDIDDTISKTNQSIRAFAYQYDQEVLGGKGYKDKDAFRFKDMLHWTDENVESFMETVRSGDLFYNLQTIPDSALYINKLYDEGYKIYFITRRRDVSNVRKATETWLNNNGYKYHKLFMNMDEKGNICKQENVELFIDNDIRHIKEVTDQGIDSILIEDDFNKNVTEYNKLSTWQEIYNYIKR